MVSNGFPEEMTFGLKRRGWGRGGWGVGTGGRGLDWERQGQRPWGKNKLCVSKELESVRLTSSERRGEREESSTRCVCAWGGIGPDH